jgi:Ca2+-binding RTX toxin-like protein
MSFSVELDRDSLLFDLYLSYSIGGYSDPETGEYFGDTSWTLTVFDLDAATSGSSGGFAAESETVAVNLGLGPDASLQSYRIELNALNTFSGVTAYVELGVQSAANATGEQSITGGTGSDVLLGGAGADSLAGLGGGDHLDGGDAADALDGGEGSDTLVGGAGADTLTGGSGNDTYWLDDAEDTLVESADGGYDTAYARVSATLGEHLERLVLWGVAPIDGTGGAGDEQIEGNAAANRLDGAGGDDWLRGGAGEDTLAGGDGADTLDGGEGSDLLRGGAGNDTYVLHDAGDRIVELAGAGIDVVEGHGLARYTLGAGIDVYVTRPTGSGVHVDAHITGNGLRNDLFGGGGDDTLDGGAESDSLEGGDGDDLFLGGAGADAMRGGLGADTVNYLRSGAAVTVLLGAGSGSGGDAEGDTYLGVENAIGSGFGDVLSGYLLANRLHGGGGDDTLDGAGGNDTLSGGAGADDLAGGDGRDTLSYAGSTGGAVSIDIALQQVGGGDAGGDSISGFEDAIGSAGDDTISGSAGANALAGGAGDDLIAAGAGRDVVAGGAGADTLDGGAGEDTLSYAGSAAGVTLTLRLGQQAASGGDAEGDVVGGFEHARGGLGDDTLEGNGGGNRLAGGAGDDLLSGLGGDDTLVGGAGADTLRGGAGSDTLSYAGSAVGVAVSLGSGAAGNGDASGDRFVGFENLEGGNGSDYLVGDDAGNRIAGGAGADAIDGRGGDDFLSGGLGADTFYLYNFGGSIGNDTILDFEGTDQLYPSLGDAFDTYEEIMAVASASGDGTVFDFGELGTLTVLGVAPEAFTADSFFFG